MPALGREQLVPEALQVEPRQESGPEHRLGSSKRGDWPVGHGLDHRDHHRDRHPYPGQLQLRQEEVQEQEGAPRQEVGWELPAQWPVPLQLHRQ